MDFQKEPLLELNLHRKIVEQKGQMICEVLPLILGYKIDQCKLNGRKKVFVLE